MKKQRRFLQGIEIPLYIIIGIVSLLIVVDMIQGLFRG